MDFKIRNATVTDTVEILDLIDLFDRQKALRPSEETVAKTILDIESLGGAVLVVGEEGSVIGTCTICICPNLSWSASPYAMIENVLVAPEHRRIGVGSALLAEAVRLAEVNGCYRISLMTGPTREESFGFYESAGFSKSKVGFQLRFN